MNITRLLISVAVAAILMGVFLSGAYLYTNVGYPSALDSVGSALLYVGILLAVPPGMIWYWLGSVGFVSELRGRESFIQLNPGLGRDFCWHARNFAAMYGKESVDTVHVLLAAAEVTPAELHGHDELTPLAISAALANMGIGNDGVQMAENLPQELTPAAQALVKRVMSYAARTARPPSLGDIWVAIAHEGGFVRQVMEKLSINQNNLYQRVSGL
jgi:hypothetical protein